ncbi:GrpB family protein [Alteribacter natronophilus]|uniref:GrpB family protein n=1 Tax=Alteribacter natronophilus TaxID=2583810 RepID=UPI00110F1E51|nr:GrpB family protein [Alteribacter natronophilus]TMW71419.1 GrpB family protein [Alteribacter natronophilus]
MTPDLGLNKNEVRITDYNPDWKKEADRTISNILKHTGLQPEQVAHVGSTAIPGIKAKPIIDLAAAIPSLNEVDDSLISSLRRSGFLRLRVERQNEIVFARFRDSSYQVKTHFLHLTEADSDLWHDLIFFRDHLNAAPVARRQYEQLKLAYTARTSENISDYTSHKEQFVKSIYRLRKNGKRPGYGKSV